MHMKTLGLVLGGLVAGLAVTDGTARAASRPVVVELFTSEGCSSCPPADAYLTELTGRSDVLPLAFHVTYWNSLGWRDPYSMEAGRPRQSDVGQGSLGWRDPYSMEAGRPRQSDVGQGSLGWRDPYSMEAATSRQASYAGRLGGGSYTPEIVVDGRAGMVGSERGEVASAISSARGAAAGSPAVRLARSAGGLSVTIGEGRGGGRILLVGFDPQHQTAVGRGENSGRTLLESNIVRSIRTIGTYSGTPQQMSESRGVGQSAAVLIQAADGSIVGAGRL